MALEADVKKAIIDEYATHPGDTGSPEVQIALLTKRITGLTEHLKGAQARPPHASWPAPPGRPASPSPGYLSNVDIERYRALIARLGIRR